MSWELRQTPEGWEWSCCQSAYGAAGGIESTKAAAAVELALAEAAIMEHPYPPEMAKVMRENPERFAGE